MADVPSEVGYGTIVGRFVSFVADSLDVNAAPDEVPITGTVLLTPLTSIVRYPTTTPPRLAIAQKVTAQIVNGDLCSPDGEPGGVVVIATDQPQGQPTSVQWRASFRFDGVSSLPPDVTFNVPVNGTVDLATIASIPPAPGTVIVVSHEDALAAAADADAAAASASTAQIDAAAADADAAAAAQSATNSAASAAASALSANNAVASVTRVVPSLANLPSQAVQALFTDLFNRADGAIGAPWVNPMSAGGVWSVRSNTAAALGTLTALEKVYQESGNADVAVQAKLAAVATNAVTGGSSSPGLMARFVPNAAQTQGGSFWAATLNGLYFNDGSSYTSKGLWTPVCAAGDTIRLECRGPVISVLVDYGSVGTFVTKLVFNSAGENLTATKHGVRSSNNASNGNAFDDFKVETLPGGQSVYIQDTATVVVGDGTRWRTLYGDTGFRNVTSLIVNANVVPTGQLAYLRRYGNTVDLYIQFQVVAAPASPFSLITLHPGFRTPIQYYGLLTTYGQANQANIINLSGDINIYSAAPNTTYRMRGTWLTTDAWPTFLPGVVGIAPN